MLVSPKHISDCRRFASGNFRNTFDFVYFDRPGCDDAIQSTQEGSRGMTSEWNMDERSELGCVASEQSEMPPIELGDMDSDEERQLWSFGNDFDEEEWTW